jgi:hypothetical protein
MEKMEENKNDMKKKMDENKEEIQKSMKELQNSMSSLIIQTLDEKSLKKISKFQEPMKIKVVFMLNNLLTISNSQVDLTLIVELIMVGVLNSTFPRLN